MIKLQQHNWISNSKVESIGILSIPFLCVAILFLIPSTFIKSDTMPEFTWLFLVVFIDVGHVYSTIYRTYVDKPLINKHRNLFFGLPILLLVVSIMLHTISSMLFWRCLAYFAVYHFIRQQYGFLKIYSRKNTYSKIKQRIDAFTIYSVTILPIVYWHFSPDRNFDWFLKGDFIVSTNTSHLPYIINALFFFVLIVYLISEIQSSIHNKFINFQKNCIVLGTALSWYIGIIYFNSDFVFTFLNVVCHGVPYMTLVWIHGKKTYSKSTSTSFLKLVYGRFSLLIFLLPLVVFAYVEEGFWDAFVWNEHNSVFTIFKNISHSLSKNILNIVVPLLALPQLFHYVIDGFIWKIRNDKFEWTKILK
jgi:hypothetical protein